MQTETIRFRVTPAAADLIQRAADSLQVPLSEWLRSLAIREARKVLEVAPNARKGGRPPRRGE